MISFTHWAKHNFLTEVQLISLADWAINSEVEYVAVYPTLNWKNDLSPVLRECPL